MNFIKKYFLIILLLTFIVSCIIYWLYWHLQPFTADAFIFADTRTVTPWVEGYISHIFVKNNQEVKKGEPLFTTYSPPYELKVKILEHEISVAKEKLSSCRAAMLRSGAEIKRFEADIVNSRYLSTRAQEMLKTAAISEDYAVLQQRNLQVDLARKAAAEYQVKSLEHECKALDAEIRKLEAALTLARIWHDQTTVKSLSDGIVTNMMISPGAFCKPGEVLFAIIDTGNWFVQANFKESELSEIRPGVKAVIRLRQHPGKIYHGIVESTSFSAEKRQTSPRSGMTEVKKENEWFLLPQRFPVQIRIIDPDSQLNFGASAYVTLDIPSRPFRQFFWELFL